MAANGWSVLYTRVPTQTLERIKAAAAIDERSVAKWVEIHFREFFEKEDERCDSITSTPDSDSSSSGSGS